MWICSYSYKVYIFFISICLHFIFINTDASESKCPQNKMQPALQTKHISQGAKWE